MIQHSRRWVSSVAASLLLCAAATAGEFFEVDGVALRGHDPVAYFEAGRPMPGVDALTHTYLGSVFRFASEANRQKFIADPEKYAPQYGGFCALGTANGYKVSTEPDAFKVVDGKLYLNYNLKVLQIWSKDPHGYITRADLNWPEVSKMSPKD